jgi:phage shock protein A
MAGLEQMLAKLESQASRARQLGWEDLVHVALSQLNSARGQLADLASQLHQLLAEEAKLASVTQMLQAKIDA